MHFFAHAIAHALILVLPAFSQSSSSSWNSIPNLSPAAPLLVDISAGANIPCSDVLTSLIKTQAAMGTVVRLNIARPGNYCLKAKSYHCDTYIVIRGSSGAIITENDDGPCTPHASAEFSLSPLLLARESPLSVDILSVDGIPGTVALELTCVEGDVPLQRSADSEVVFLDLETRRNRIDELFATDNRYRSRAYRTLARSLFEIGSIDRGFESIRESLRVTTSIEGDDSVDVLMTRHEQATWGIVSGRYDEAQRACEAIMQVPSFYSIIGYAYAQHIYCYLGQAYLNSDRCGDALNVLLEGCALMRGRAEFTQGNRSVYCLLLATACDALGDRKGCLKYLAEAESLLGIPNEIHDDSPIHVVLGVMCLRASCLWRMKSYEKAEDVLRVAVRLGSEHVGDNHPSVVSAKIRLGKALTNTGQYSEASKILEDVWAIVFKIIPEGHIDRLHAMCAYSALLSATGKQPAARRVLQSVVLALAPPRGDSLRFGQIGIEIVEQLVDSGEWSAAELVLSAMIESDSNMKDERPGLYRDAQRLLCWAYMMLGMSEKSISVAQELVDVASSEGVESSVDSASRKVLLAHCLVRGGRFGEARVVLDAASTLLFESSSDSKNERAEVAAQMATVLLEMRDVNAAQRVLSWAISVCGVESTRFVRLIQCRVLRLISSTYLELSMLSEADEYAERALGLASELFGDDSFQVLELLGLCAIIKSKQRLFCAAREYLDRADRITALISESDQRVWIEVQVARAMVSCELGNYSDAIDVCGRLLHSLSRQPFRHVDTLVEVSSILARAGSFHRAWESVQDAWMGCVESMSDGSTLCTEYELLCVSASMRKCVSQLVYLARKSADVSLINTAFKCLCEWKGWVWKSVRRDRAAAWALEGDQGAVRGSIGSVQYLLNRAVSELGRLDGVRSESRLDSVVRKRRAEERAAVASALVNATSKESERALDTSNRKRMFVDFLVVSTEGKYNARPIFSAESVLGDGERVLVWMSSDRRSVSSLVDLGSSGEIIAAISEYVKGLQACDSGVISGNRGFDVRSHPSSRIRSLLWDPIAEHLEGVSTLCISPDGFLGAFPFECIVDKDGKYLIEKYSIVYGIEVGEFESGGNGIDPNAGGLIVGGIDRPLGADGQAPRSVLGGGNVWPPLEWAEEECSRIAGLFASGSNRRSTTILRGSEATESRVRESLPGASIVHFATHGFFPRSESIPWLGASLRGQRSGSFLFSGIEDLAREYPGLLSGLVLAEDRGATSEEAGDDGLLTAEEVSWLDLSKCELVVLSACGSGLGEARGGEGLIGLRRAFRMAGAKTVISSLWPISDRATAELMEMFYRNLLTRGLGRGEALRAAQLSMIQSNRAKYQGNALPTTWAAFVLDGDWK